MGIPLLTTYVSEHGFLKNYCLHDTELIIDKANLMGVFNQMFNDDRKDHFFGGDYNYYAQKLRNFFVVLKQCNVKPLFIKESKSTNKNQMNTKIHRISLMEPGKFGTENTSLCNSFTENNPNEKFKLKAQNSNSLLSCKVFNDVLYEFNFDKQESSEEADDLIAQKAVELGVPILSNDSDFFILDLSAGVIFINSILENLEIYTNDDGKKYILCKLFTFDHFKNKFPGLNQMMLTIVAKPLLMEKNTLILFNITNETDKIKQMTDLFYWLSQQCSIESAIKKLEASCQNSFEFCKEIINKIKTNFLNAKSSIEQVYKAETKINNKITLPNYLQIGSPNKFIIQIYCNRQHIFYPIVEDPTLVESAHSCSFNLCYQIYGILRVTENLSDEDNKITQYYCDKGIFLEKGQKVTAKFYEKNTNKKLPTIWEIENLNKNDCLSLFWNILEIDSSLNTKLNNIFKKHSVNDVSENEMVQFCSVFSAFIYFERNLKVDLSIEFIYAMLLNVLLSGYIEKPVDGFDKKYQYFENTPDLSKYDFVPKNKNDLILRITYYNNAFQSCLEQINLLAQILNVSNIWFVCEIVFGFQGSLVHNLTKKLMNEKLPWSYLKENVFKNNLIWAVYEELVVLALELSERTFNFNVEKGVIPHFLTQKENQKLLTKGLLIDYEEQQKGTLLNSTQINNTSETRMQNQIIRINNVEKNINSKDIFDKIISQNNLENFKNCYFQIVFEKIDKNGNKYVVAKTDQELFKKLIDLRNIKLGTSLSYITRHVLIIKCTKCNEYGHYLKDCKNNETCVSCAGPHKSNDCIETVIKCSNCEKKNQKGKLNKQDPIDSNHRANSPTCPQYIQYRNHSNISMRF